MDPTLRRGVRAPRPPGGARAWHRGLIPDGDASTSGGAVAAIWLDGRCVGTVDYDPDATDGLEPGDVNVAYGVAAEVRGRGVAVRAVEHLSAENLEAGVGHRAVIRADTRNPASSRVAEKTGFTHLRDIRIASVAGADAVPEVLRVHVRELRA